MSLPGDGLTAQGIYAYARRRKAMGNVSFGLMRHLANARRSTRLRLITRADEMNTFIKNFRRLERGLWECDTAGEFYLVSGRIQITRGSRFARGTTFMGIDLARLLDEEYEKTQSTRS